MALQKKPQKMLQKKKQELTLMQNYNLKLLFLVMYSNKKKTEKLKHGTII